MAKVKYYPDTDTLVVYLDEEQLEDYFEDRGDVKILYREGRIIGFEVWNATRHIKASEAKAEAKAKV